MNKRRDFQQSAVARSCSTLPDREELSFRTPTVEDAAGIFQMVKDSGVLDCNSRYVYLLWTEFFACHCLVVEDAEGLAGFVIGFCPEEFENAYFVWQIAVAPRLRGRGIARQLVLQTLQSQQHHDVQWLLAHVGDSNTASERLFRSLASRLGADLEIGAGFTADMFGDSGHESERLFRIGPFVRPPTANVD